MLIDNSYNIGEEVYLKTDEEQLVRIITGIQVRDSGLLYALSLSTVETWHYDFEISKEKNHHKI